VLDICAGALDAHLQVLTAPQAIWRWLRSAWAVAQDGTLVLVSLFGIGLGIRMLVRQELMVIALMALSIGVCIMLGYVVLGIIGVKLLEDIRDSYLKE
jgi:hypothetical protein